MIQKTIRPTHSGSGSEWAENLILAGQQNVVLDSKPALKLQLRSLSCYTTDAQLNVIHVQFSFPSRRGNLF